MKLNLQTILIVVSFVLLGCQTNKIGLDLENQSEDVQALVDQDEQIQADSAQEALTKARVAWNNGKLDLAQVLYVKAFDLDPKNIDLLVEMAGRYRQLDKPELVTACYQLILEQDPDHPLREDYGLLLLQEHKFDQAQAILQKLVEKDGKNWKAHNGLGIIADIKNNHVLAQSDFQKALALQPNNPEVLNNLGYSLYMSGKWAPAQLLFKRALQVDPNFKKALFNDALVEAHQKNYPLALSLFSKVISAAEANNNVGYSAMMNQDYVEADYYLNQALKLSPTYYEKAHDNLRQLDGLRSENGGTD